MSAVIVTGALRGWGFAPGTRLGHALSNVRVRRPVSQAGSPGLRHVREYLASCHRQPDPSAIIARFDVSRATAYRYIAMWRDMQEAA